METKPAELHEGPEATGRFDNEIRFLLSIPRSTLLKREKAYRKKVAINPRKRGPKRKATA